MKQHYESKANIKKFATQASKGGSVILTLELPLTDDTAGLAITQNQMCVVSLDFSADSVEKADGQKMLDLDEKNQDTEE